MNYKNYHIITVKYLPATNTRGSRVKMTSKRFNQSVTIPFNYQFTDIREMALEYLKEKGHNIIGIGDDAVILTYGADQCFKPLK